MKSKPLFLKPKKKVLRVAPKFFKPGDLIKSPRFGEVTFRSWIDGEETAKVWSGSCQDKDGEEVVIDFQLRYLYAVLNDERISI